MADRLLDTNIVSYEVKRHPLAMAYRPHLAGYRLWIAYQTLAELLEWAENSGWGASRRARLEHRIARLSILDVNRAVCEQWAFVRTVRRSRQIRTADAWIAATALAYGLELVTHNPADFAGIPGLTVITEAA